MSCFNLFVRDFGQPLDTAFLRRLKDVCGFMGFAPFIPSDVLKNVDVYLDDKKTKETVVTLEELEKELESLKKELESLLQKMRDMLQKRTGQDELAKLDEEIGKINKKIKKIEDHISECRKFGKDSIAVETELLGYYTRCGRSGKREIVLLMGTLINYHPDLTAIVFVHELMHAFFDKHEYEHPYCPVIEEPIAEYGMLCFMEMFERLTGYKGILQLAIDHVKAKKDDIGICHYGFGHYLYENKSTFGVEWVSLFHSNCHHFNLKTFEKTAYESMISPVSYPRHEYWCEEKLNDLLRPIRFYFKNEACYYAKTPRYKSDRIVINVDKKVREDDYFQNDYLFIAPSEISLTFEDKSGRKITGNAKVYKGSSTPKYMRIYIETDKNFISSYCTIFGCVNKEFLLFEKKANPAEWEAIEI